MTEAQDKKDEEQFEFTAEGEALGYICMEQAQVLAIQHARDNLEFYGRRYHQGALVWEVASAEESDDYYDIRLSFRPAGRFRGQPGIEQFTLDKTGTIEVRQILDEPVGRRAPMLALSAAVLLVVAGGIGVAFAAGMFAATAVPTPIPRPIQSSPFTVTKTEDTNDGVCDADCSLRESIVAANPRDTITIPQGIYTLTLGAELKINKDLSIVGAGVDDTTIQASVDPSTADFRVFKIISGDITLSELTIQHGNTIGRTLSSTGAGILNHGTLGLTETIITNNKSGFLGGGIYNGPNGTLTVTNTIVENNDALQGGGINNAGNLTVRRSSVSNNTQQINKELGVFNAESASCYTDAPFPYCYPLP